MGQGERRHVFEQGLRSRTAGGEGPCLRGSPDLHGRGGGALGTHRMHLESCFGSGLVCCAFSKPYRQLAGGVTSP